MVWSIIGIAIGIWLFVKYVSPAIDRAFNKDSAPTPPPISQAPTPPQFIPVAPPAAPPQPPRMAEKPPSRDPLVPPEGWYDDPLSADRLRYSDGVAWTDRTARKTASPSIPAIASEGEHEDEEEVEEAEEAEEAEDDDDEGPVYAPSVTLAVHGLDDAIGPSCRLTISVEPGFVVIDCCRETCLDSTHALVLTADEASEACERLWIAASHGADTHVTTGPQNTDLSVDWITDEDDGTESVAFDWTGEFLDQEILAAWEEGQRPVEADCGTLYLSGGSDDPGSPLDLFATILYESASSAREWDADRTSQESVSSAMSRFGTLIDD